MAAAGGFAAAATAPAKAEFDIFTKRIAKFLDPQFVLMVLENSIRPLEIYDEKEVDRIELDIARRTQLVDLLEDCYQRVHGEGAALPADLAKAREAKDAAMQGHVAACGPLIDIIGLDPTRIGDKEAELRGQNLFHAEHLAAEHGVTPTHIEALFALAKFRYDCGEDQAAASLLRMYEELRFPPDEERTLPLPLLWGQFAVALMDETGDWETADLKRREISEVIERGDDKMTDMQKLQTRAWLLHWSLFILANHPAQREKLLDWYFEETNLNTIALVCPWLLRYLITGAMVHKHRGQLMSVLKRMLTEDVRSGGDPMVSFLSAVLLDFDFARAQAIVYDCSSAIAVDQFLLGLTSQAEFVEAARAFVFDVYARVHAKIDLKLLAEQIGLPLDEAERWVVDKIRTARLDAKVDSQAATVEMIQPSLSVHWSVADKVRDAAMRAKHLLETVEAESANMERGAAGRK